MPEETKQPETTETPQPEVQSETPQAPPESEAAAQPEAPQFTSAETSQAQPELQINVDPNTHMAIAVQDFDRKIAEAKANVANLEKDRANYIYDTNVKLLINQAQQNQQQNSEPPQG